MTAITMAASAISDIAFAAAMEGFTPFEPEPVIAVALSGGADSLALAWLVQNWCRTRRGRAVALIVDHKLRDESTAEARQAAAFAAQLGLEPHILTWQDGLAARQMSGKQARARSARYALMAQFCRDNNILHLATGHHKDDQTETLLMQQRRGSLAGKGMPAQWFGLAGHCPDIRLIRPLIAFSRTETEATCRLHDLNWINDPSNMHPSYERARLRQAGDNRLVHRPVDDDMPRWLSDIHISPMGFARFPNSLLHDRDDADLTPGLSLLLRAMGNRTYPLPLHQVKLAVSALHDGQDHVLGHCRILHRRHHIWITRELQHALDGFTLPSPPPDTHWAALCETGRLQLRHQNLPAHFTGLPPAIQENLPALKQHDQVIALPAFDDLQGWSATPGTSLPKVHFRPRYPASGTLAR